MALKNIKKNLSPPRKSWNDAPAAQWLAMSLIRLSLLNRTVSSVRGNWANALGWRADAVYGGSGAMAPLNVWQNRFHTDYMMIWNSPKKHESAISNVCLYGYPSTRFLPFFSHFNHPNWRLLHECMWAGSGTELFIHNVSWLQISVNSRLQVLGDTYLEGGGVNLMHCLMFLCVSSVFLGGIWDSGG